MVAATKTGSRLTRNPNKDLIRDMTADIRAGWSIGQRHHRARLALNFQRRLFGDFVCTAESPQSSTAR